MIRLSATYRDRQQDFQNPKQFKVVVEDYHRDIIRAGITTAKQLGDAINHGRQTWKWFPKPAEIIEAHREVCKSMPRVNMISDHATCWSEPTPAEIERSKKLVSLAVQAVMGQITFTECEKRQNEILNKNSTV